ncbi:MAG: YsnF/AvaK domain-containing protein [Janthinobacterium lividum]
MSKTVVGLFPDNKDAQAAMTGLETMGIKRNSVQVMTSDARDKVLNALTSVGVPQDDSHLYAEAVRRGGALVIGSVEDTQADQAVAVLDRNNSLDIDKLGSRYRESGYTGFDAAQAAYAGPDLQAERDLNSQITIPIVAEELQVGKRSVERGGARIHTFVTERPVEAQVTLRDETVTIDRRPVDRLATDADFQTQDITLTETGEEAVVSKTARVVEEVVVGKTATDRTETVRDTVRRTDVEVDDLDTNSTTRR